MDRKLDAFRAEQGREPTVSETAGISAKVKQNVCGTVQAYILKGDQGQNTCIFSTERPKPKKRACWRGWMLSTVATRRSHRPC